MLVPPFGPTMNVIAYSPFQDGGSAAAVGESDRAIASAVAHKPVRLVRWFRFIGFSPGWCTTHQQSVAEATFADQRMRSDRCARSPGITSRPFGRCPLRQ